mmetsp:Transcript_34480/g.55387  ORF Transcript_34480/g.55387 Transcript_34480/m.55387 type:complete len:219 (-) Transcript_34480:309-965(-)
MDSLPKGFALTSSVPIRHHRVIRLASALIWNARLQRSPGRAPRTAIAKVVYARMGAVAPPAAYLMAAPNAGVVLVHARLAQPHTFSIPSPSRVRFQSMGHAPRTACAKVVHAKVGTVAPLAAYLSTAPNANLMMVSVRFAQPHILSVPTVECVSFHHRRRPHLHPHRRPHLHHYRHYTHRRCESRPPPRCYPPPQQRSSASRTSSLRSRSNEEARIRA